MPQNDGRSRARALGSAGEARAREFLQARGMRLLEAGWRCRLGELDLVMQDGEVLVFVEVRTRSEASVVSAIDSVDTRKQARFVRAARAWLAAHPAGAELPARFDIVAIDGSELHWLRDAFSVPAY